MLECVLAIALTGFSAQEAAKKIGPVMPPRDKALISIGEMRPRLSVKTVQTPAGTRLHLDLNGQIYCLDELTIKHDGYFHSVRIGRTGELVKTTSRTYP